MVTKQKNVIKLKQNLIGTEVKNIKCDKTKSLKLESKKDKEKT